MGTRKKKEAVKGLDDELGELRVKRKQLEKRVHEAELRAEAYSLMIDMAEKELKVAIRIPSSTRRFGRLPGFAGLLIAASWFESMHQRLA